jgi:hypothetical protein
MDPTVDSDVKSFHRISAKIMDDITSQAVLFLDACGFPVPHFIWYCESVPRTVDGRGITAHG